MQTQEVIDDILHHQGELEQQRSPWEPIWREVDQRVNPLGEGAFNERTPGQLNGLDIFDHTATLALERFTAAYTGMIIPRGERYHTLTSTSSALNDNPNWQSWVELATDRLFAARYSPQAAFSTEAQMNIRSLGSYGSGPMWIDSQPGRGLFYRTLHLAECYVDEDYRGQVDTLHRKFKWSVRKIVQMFGSEQLPPAIRKDFDDRKFTAEHELLHVVRPRGDRDPERFDYRSMAIESRYISLSDKAQIREGGFRTRPIAFSRYMTGPRERYGRSPAMQVMGAIRTANAIAKTLLRAGHKAVDPPLLTPEDGVLSTIHTAPGKATVGGLGIDGKPLVVPLQTGGNLPIGMELLNNEREPIRDAFLEKVWSLVLERRDRMTATEVLEISRMQGMMLAPMASRQETEWLGPQIERELDILTAAGYIPPPPPEFREEGAAIKIIYDNPLSRAAKAEEAIGFGRLLEMLAPIAAIDDSAYDAISTDRAPRELARSLAVRSTYMATPEESAAKREARENSKQMASMLGGLKDAAGAVKDLASARGEETALV